MFRRKEGFTLIELLIVILIIAILVAIALPLYLRSQTTARQRTCQANLRTIDGCINSYRAEFPDAGDPDMATLTGAGSAYLKTEPFCPAGNKTPYGFKGSAESYEASCVVPGITNHTL